MQRFQKEPYNQLAAKDKARYDKQLIEFVNQSQETSLENQMDLRKPRKSFDTPKSISQEANRNKEELSAQSK